MKNSWIDNAIWGFVLFSLGLFCLGASWIVKSYRDTINHNRELIEECIADGHKEYECQGIINGRQR